MEAINTFKATESKVEFDEKFDAGMNTVSAEVQTLPTMPTLPPSISLNEVKCPGIKMSASDPDQLLRIKFKSKRFSIPYANLKIMEH